MKRYAKFAFAVMLVSCLAGCGGAPEEKKAGDAKEAAGSDATFFFNARVIAGDGSPAKPDTAFLVQAGKITALGPKADIKIPQGAGRMDLEGQTIMPFLFNLHSHPGLNTGAGFSPDNYKRESVMNDLNRSLYYGISAVLIAGSDKGDLNIQIRDEQRAGKTGGAKIFTAGRGITAKGGWPSPLLKEMPIQVANEAEGIGAVDENADKKVDFIKIYLDDNASTPKLSPAISRAIINQAHRKNLKVIAHVFYLADAKELVKAGVDGIVHSIRDKEVDDELIADMKAKNVFFTPTLTAHESKFIYAEKPTWLGEQSMREVYPAQLSAFLADSVFIGKMKRDPNLDKFKAQYEIAVKNLKKMAAGGVRIGLGTDSGISNTFPGYFEHRELELMATAGMSTSDLITAATQTSAEIIGMADAGTLTVGKRADFMVMSSDPLEKIVNTRQIDMLFVAGLQIERLPLIQGIQMEVPKITQADRQNEAAAANADAVEKADAKLPHFGPFPQGPSSMIGGMAIPTPKYSTFKNQPGPPAKVTVTGKATAAEWTAFYSAALAKYGWKAAGSCFEKKNIVSSKTNSLCIEASSGTAVITIAEK